jgi:hypothetical protein
MLLKKIKLKYRGLINKAKRFYFYPPLNAQKKYPCELSIAAIFQNEASYLKEWLEFHKLIGCQHFYLFNHLSTDHFQEVLKPYKEQGLVTLIEWPFPAANLEIWNDIQCKAYEYALKLAKHQTKWLAFIDTDEFLFSVNEDNLANTLKAYESFAGVCVNWQIFGTSGVAKIPSDELLIENLYKKAPENYPSNLHVKSIVRPEAVASCQNPHNVIFKWRYFQVDTLKNKFEGPFSPTIVNEKLRINHYSMRDEHYLYGPKLSRQKAWGQGNNIINNNNVQICNSMTDTSIQRFIPKLKKVMNK